MAKEAKVTAILDDGSVIDKQFYPFREHIKEMRFKHNGTKITVLTREGKIIWNGNEFPASGELVFFRRVRQDFTMLGGMGDKRVTYHIGLGDLVLQVEQ